MGFKLNPMQILGLANIFEIAIKDGTEWGKSLVENPKWNSDRDRVSNHAIYEAALWSTGMGTVSGVLGIFGIPLDLHDSLHSQVKLSSALFTIHGFDTTDESLWVIIIAATFGVKLTDLAASLAFA